MQFVPGPLLYLSCITVSKQLSALLYHHFTIPISSQYSVVSVQYPEATLLKTAASWQTRPQATCTISDILKF